MGEFQKSVQFAGHVVARSGLFPPKTLCSTSNACVLTQTPSPPQRQNENPALSIWYVKWGWGGGGGGIVLCSPGPPSPRQKNSNKGRPFFPPYHWNGIVLVKRRPGYLQKAACRLMVVWGECKGTSFLSTNIWAETMLTAKHQSLKPQNMSHGLLHHCCALKLKSLE